MTTLKIKLLHPNARLPEYKTDGASGMDLFAVEDAFITEGDTATINLGIAIELPDGFEAQIRPRSSLSRMGLVCNLGTIDHDYRGELAAVFTNLTPHGPHVFRIYGGDRIAQLVIAPVERVAVELATELSETARGAGGFGHTGK